MRAERVNEGFPEYVGNISMFFRFGDRELNIKLLGSIFLKMFILMEKNVAVKQDNKTHQKAPKVRLPIWLQVRPARLTSLVQ